MAQLIPPRPSIEKAVIVKNQNVSRSIVNVIKREYGAQISASVWIVGMGSATLVRTVKEK
jgi:ribulose 1,5-bisphosphate synthetase/thiazole synthase